MDFCFTELQEKKVRQLMADPLIKARDAYICPETDCSVIQLFAPACRVCCTSNLLPVYPNEYIQAESD